MNRTTLIAVGAVALVGVALLVWFWPFGGNGNVLRLPGIVEIQEVRLGSKVGGRVAAVHIREGDIVEPGKVLVTFEAPELERQIDQQAAKTAALEQEWKKAEYGPRKEEIAAARAAEAAAKARMERMDVGFREEEKKQAKSDLEASESDFRQAEEDWDRIKRLYPSSASKAELDAANAARERTRGRYNSVKAKFDLIMAGNREEDKAAAHQEWEQAKANLDLLNAGTREEDKRSAEARYKEAAARLEELKVNYAERQVIAKDKCIIEVLAVRPGDLVPPNQPVIRVLRAEDLWLKVYVPEPQLSKVRLQQKVEVRIDAYPDQVFEGTVIQVASISEFTPRNVQSADERNYQVFAVKVRVDNPHGIFKAGLAAEVVLPLKGPHE
jgi:multidrug resistance efflux pump